MAKEEKKKKKKKKKAVALRLTVTEYGKQLMGFYLEFSDALLERQKVALYPGSFSCAVRGHEPGYEAREMGNAF